MRVVTVTGSSAGINPLQREALRAHLMGASLVRHGVCVGVDEVAHWIAYTAGVPIEGHPGLTKGGEVKHRARINEGTFSKLWPEEWFLDRNGIMVEHSTEVVAVVRSPIWYRSGEWATVTRALRRGLPVVLIPPDGIGVPG